MTPDAKEAIMTLKEDLGKKEKRVILSFYEFLEMVRGNPQRILRNIFQLFHDMVKIYVGNGTDEYPDDPESIGFVKYDCSGLLEEGVDNPFFADRLFANRFIRHVESLKQGSQQNRIYIFEGPHGCGKSTFLNNLLGKFEKYTETKEGQSFEIFWVLDEGLIRASQQGNGIIANSPIPKQKTEIICPSHDHPILIIPKKYREATLDRLLDNNEIKDRISAEKEYEWVFKEEACTVCKSLFWALFEKLESLDQVLNMVKARPLKFDRRLSEGICVFNPGDKPTEDTFLTNKDLQRKLDSILGVSNPVKYVFSRMARANNGIYALMDVKGHNQDRLLDLHNIISEGLHRVEDIEERIYPLFVALMNPEDKGELKDDKRVESMQERIRYIKVPYVMEPQTEVKIYRSIFGKRIDDLFQPRVLESFARVIISSRISTESEALSKWISDLKKYNRYSDEYGLLLRMEIYSGIIPPWLSEEDKRKFTAEHRRRLVVEAEKEGEKGFTGRDSIRMFGDFLKRHGSQNHLINMANICDYFKRRIGAERDAKIPKKFLDPLRNWYDFAVLGEIKEALYFYNTTQISEEILNFLFAVNFERDSIITCPYTGKRVEVTKDFFKFMAHLITGEQLNDAALASFIKKIQQKYIEVLAKEVPGPEERRLITETDFYCELFESYVRNIKEKSLQPFLKNENFQAATRAFGAETFKTFDDRTKERVEHMIRNLIKKFNYTENGAKEICLYAIDNNLIEKFAKTVP